MKLSQRQRQKKGERETTRIADAEPHLFMIAMKWNYAATIKHTCSRMIYLDGSIIRFRYCSTDVQ